jgi:YidC/Oxa1 family membrane protein insertase
MYQALSDSFEMNFLGIDLSESASQALSQSVVHALPYFVLILLVAFTGWFQQRQIQGRNTAATQNPQQQMIMKLMPILLPVISFSLPGGLVLYFLVSNTYRIGQQAWITRTLYSPDGPVALTKSGTGGDPGGKDGKAKDEKVPAKPDRARKSGRTTPGGGATEANGSGNRASRTSDGKGRPTPKRGTTAPASKRTGGSSGKKTKKTYSADPKAKGRAGRTAGGSPAVEPRGRKAKKKRD